MKLTDKCIFKMSTKIVVVKQEQENDFNTLNITIHDDTTEGNASEITYSQWCEGKPQRKKSDKSSRLVVRVVSDKQGFSIDLDSCAREIDNFDDYIANRPLNYSDFNNNFFINEHKTRSNVPAKKNSGTITLLSSKVLNESDNDINDSVDFTQTQLDDDYNEYVDEISDMALSYRPTEHVLGDKPSFSPLEYSLEKVKINNARIMHNINMLNRTLKYTKYKENKEIMNEETKTFRSFPCRVCGKCFVYETGLRRHYSMRHTIAELQPRWQTVWTCGQCFQVWPNPELATKHAIKCCPPNSTDRVQEIKTSSLLQCEFCEKVFTSIPHLVRHAKVHTTINNYECNVCQVNFLAYKDAEHHWLECTWLKVCYNFTLQKTLLCNACDRKFKTYEQLYNHRYKMCHFITKIHINDAGNKSAAVYQCEMCAEWFHSVQQLHVHRNKYHPRNEINTHGQINVQGYQLLHNLMIYDSNGEPIDVI